MNRLLAIVILLATAQTAWADSWGGTGWQNHQDSVDMVWIRQSSPDNNYGTHVQMIVGNLSTGDSLDGVFAPADDRTPGGATLDSLIWFWFYDATDSYPNAVDESLKIAIFPLKVAWSEGNNNGTASDAGESDWDDAAEGTLAWDDPGAKGANDRHAAVDTILMYGTVGGDSIWYQTLVSGYGPTKIAANESIKFKVTGANLSDAVAKGCMAEVRWTVGATQPTVRWHTDNASTSGFRPYPVVYYTPAGGPVGAWGAGTHGAETVGK